MDGTTLVKKAIDFFLAESKERLAKKERDWVDKSLTEASQVARCVAVALLSLALGRQPLDNEVQRLLGELIDDPAAPARARRLLGEMLMSPSRQRRARLAAVFVAGPRVCQTPDERDRLDGLVERLLDDDVTALAEFARNDSIDGFLVENRVLDGKHRILSKELPRPLPGQPFSTVSAVVLENLQALGLVSEAGNSPDQEILGPGDLAIFFTHAFTRLGRFVQSSLQHEAIRAGVEAAKDSATSPDKKR